MRLKMLALAGGLSLGLITATAVGTAMATPVPTNGTVHTSEPSSLYAFSTALALLVGAAWFVRRT